MKNKRIGLFLLIMLLLFGVELPTVSAMEEQLDDFAFIPETENSQESLKVEAISEASEPETEEDTNKPERWTEQENTLETENSENTYSSSGPEPNEAIEEPGISSGNEDSIYMGAEDTLFLDPLFAAEDPDEWYLWDGDFGYTVKEDQTAMITNYRGSNPRVEIPGFIGDHYPVTEIGDRAFAGFMAYAVYTHENIKEVIVPEGVTCIAGGAFSNLPNLEHIELPSSITEIGTRAFSNCSALHELELPQNVQKLGEAFIDDSGITCITIPASVKDESEWYSAEGALGQTVKEVIFEPGIKKIPDKFALNSKQLEKVQLPDNVVEIGQSTFCACPNLTDINLPDSVTIIREGAFSYCSALQTINLNGGFKDIGFMAFGDCHSLVSITIPGGCEIGECAFADCTNLISVTISDGLTTVGTEAFMGCTGLKRVNLPDTVKEISDRAFCNCNSLEELRLPEGLKKLGGNVFGGTKIRSLTIPASLVDSTTDYAWGAFGSAKCLTKLVFEAGIERIPDYLCMDCSSLEELEFPESVTEIGDYAFQNCQALKRIEFPEGLLSIGLMSFEGCTSLLQVSLPMRLSSIGIAAFNECRELAYAYIPESVSYIGVRAFDECPELVIHGQTGSAAETYARENNIPFNTLPMERSLLLGELKEVDTDSFVIKIDEHTYPVSEDCNLSDAVSILLNYDNKTVIARVSGGEIVAVDAVDDILIPSISAHLVSPSQILYRNGELSLDHVDLSLAVGCTVKENGFYTVSDLAVFDDERLSLTIDTAEISIDHRMLRFDSSISSGDWYWNPDPLTIFTDKQVISLKQPLTLCAGEMKTYPLKFSVDASDESVKSQMITKAVLSFCAYCKKGEEEKQYYGSSRSISVSNLDLVNENAQIINKNTEASTNLSLAQKLLSSVTVAWDPNLNYYFPDTTRQNMIKDYLTVWLSMVVGRDQISYCSNNKLLKKVNEKLGINPGSLLLGRKETASFSLEAETPFGKKTFDFTAKFSEYSLGETNPFSAQGDLYWNVRDPSGIPSGKPTGGFTGMTFSNAKIFFDQTKVIAETAVKNAYAETYGNHLDEAAALIVNHTILDIIGNTKFRRLSDCYYELLKKPAEMVVGTSMTKHTITFPGNVYIYNSDRTLIGAIVDGMIDDDYQELLMDVDNEKLVFWLTGNDYYITFKGNASGSMDYEIEEWVDNEITRTISFPSVTVEKDQEFYQFVPETMGLDVGIYSLESDSGERIEADDDAGKTYTNPVFLTQIQVDTKEKTMKIGENCVLKATYFPQNATYQQVLWSSSNEKVASVLADGTVKAHAVGTATITAVSMDGGYTAECLILVEENTSEKQNQNVIIAHPTIKLTAGSLAMQTKQSTTRFKVSGMKKGDFLKKVISSNSKILKVSSINKSGTMKMTAGKKTGTVKVTFILGSGLRKTIKVKVQKNKVTAKSIKEIPKKLTMKKGSSKKLMPVIAPVTCQYKVKYLSSNKKVVTVNSSGKLFAKKKGKAAITVICGNIKKSCQVTVK